MMSGRAPAGFPPFTPAPGRVSTPGWAPAPAPGRAASSELAPELMTADAPGWDAAPGWADAPGWVAAADLPEGVAFVVADSAARRCAGDCATAVFPAKRESRAHPLAGAAACCSQTQSGLLDTVRHCTSDCAAAVFPAKRGSKVHALAGALACCSQTHSDTDRQCQTLCRHLCDSCCPIKTGVQIPCTDKSCGMLRSDTVRHSQTQSNTCRRYASVSTAANFLAISWQLPGNCLAKYMSRPLAQAGIAACCSQTQKYTVRHWI